MNARGWYDRQLSFNPNGAPVCMSDIPLEMFAAAVMAFEQDLETQNRRLPVN
jgi:hypothetical protein